MDVYQTLVDSIRTRDKITFLKQIGYMRTQKDKKALKVFLERRSLEKWLKRGHFDFVHGSESFV